MDAGGSFVFRRAVLVWNGIILGCAILEIVRMSLSSILYSDVGTSYFRWRYLERLGFSSAQSPWKMHTGWVKKVPRFDSTIGSSNAYSLNRNSGFVDILKKDTNATIFTEAFLAYHEREPTIVHVRQWPTLIVRSMCVFAKAIDSRCGFLSSSAILSSLFVAADGARASGGETRGGSDMR